MRPASAAPSISEGASNHAVATPSTTRQSVPISVMPGTVEPIPDDLLPDSDHVRVCQVLCVGRSGSVDGEAVAVGDLVARGLPATAGAKLDDAERSLWSTGPRLQCCLGGTSVVSRVPDRRGTRSAVRRDGWPAGARTPVRPAMRGC